MSINKGVTIPGLESISLAEARGVEQALIERYGLQKSGGVLLNRINSVAKSSPMYERATIRGRELLRQAGYHGF
jgi:hypothetical protein